jgi:nucleotide-binding universal stress UspA family protein
MFPVDFSDFARSAMACGLAFLRQLGLEGGSVERFALFVVPEVQVLSESQRESLDRAGRAELASWLDTLAGAEGTRPEVALGRPAAAIIERARSATDLIVIGTHGHDSEAGARRGLGSVTGEILGMAPCSMLIVPPAVELAAEVAEAIVSETAPRFGIG